jgi:hypothetical protein
MAVKLTRLTHRIAIQLHLVAESCTICSSRSSRPVRKLSDTPSCSKSRYSLVGIALDYGLDDRGSRVRFLGIFLFTAASTPALGPTQWVPGDLSLGVGWPGRETDHSPPSSSEVKECVELYLHSVNMTSWCSVKAQGQPYFSFCCDVVG